MPIKRTPSTVKMPLVGTNEPRLVSLLRTPVKETSYRFLLSVIAETLDAAASGSGNWLSIGKSMDGGTFMLTWHDGPQKADRKSVV